jgi:hypothetical protein
MDAGAIHHNRKRIYLDLGHVELWEWGDIKEEMSKRQLVHRYRAQRRHVWEEI